MKSYKVAIYVHGEMAPSYNAMRYEDAEDANLAGLSLMARWTAVVQYVVEPCDDAPNVPSTTPKEAAAQTG